ncbi:MAG: hypothetical protein A4S14_15340 [Proteobacteria bacterium SG_bin9]|nr:MAG: hypothetical protein A4S14_15340 [Proteobacteria bacterium SG_bin9]
MDLRAKPTHGLMAAAVLAAVSFVQSANAVEMSKDVADLYTSVSINPPSATSMTVCYGFVCRRRTILDFNAADRKALTQIMAAAKSAEAERAAIQKAVIWFDRRMAPELGTDRRVAYADFRHFDAAHNYDCWDTTRNTTSLLLVLREWGLLKHHTVGNPRYRGNPLRFQTPHNTAVLVDRTSKIEWAVDLWTRKFAEAPDVMPVEKWLTEN